MIYYCKDGREIHYVQVSPTDTDRVNDFFLEDVFGIIDGAKLDISNIYYIINIEAITQKILENNPEPRRFTDIYVDMFKEFIEAHKDQLIILRMGYDPHESNKSLCKMYKHMLTQEYPAAITAGFIDISTIVGLEYSKCLIYNNEIANKFIEIASRYEIMFFIGDDFSFDEIYRAVNNTEK